MLLATCLTFADMVLSLSTNIQNGCKILEFLSYPKNVNAQYQHGTNIQYFVYLLYLPDCDRFYFWQKNMSCSFISKQLHLPRLLIYSKLRQLGLHLSAYITTSYYYNVQQPNFMKLGNTLSDMNDRRPLAVDFIDALGHLPSGRQAVCQPSQRCSLST